MTNFAWRVRCVTEDKELISAHEKQMAYFLEDYGFQVISTNTSGPKLREVLYGIKKPCFAIEVVFKANDISPSEFEKEFTSLMATCDTDIFTTRRVGYQNHEGNWIQLWESFVV